MMKKDNVIDLSKFHRASGTKLKGKGLSFYNEGAYYYEQEDFEKALDRYLKAEQAGIECVDMFCDISWLYGDKDENSKAEYYARKALDLDPEYGRPYILLGNVLDEEAYYEKILEYYLIAEKKDCLDKYTAARIAWIYQKYYENSFKAREYIHKALDFDPDYSNSNNIAGWIYFCMGDMKNSLKYYLKEESLTQIQCTGYNIIAYIYYELSEYKKAIEYANKAIFADKNYSGAYYTKASVYFSQEKFDKALEYYLKAMELGYEEEEEIFIRTSFIYVEKLKEYAKALELTDKFLSKYPKNDRALYIKGYICLQMKDFRQALRFYKRAFKYKREDFDPDYYEDLVKIYIALHKYKLARQTRDAGLALYPDSEALENMEI